MTRVPRSSHSAAHFDRPADVAAHIEARGAVVVAGPESERAAVYAVAIARAAASSGRRVALADLVGDLAPVYALAGGEDAPGITDCFRDGLPLTDVARPVPDHPLLFVLPSGPGVRTEPSLTDPERWSRLVRGFGEAGGLLLVVAPASSALLRTLGEAGATLLFAGPAAEAPLVLPLEATIGASVPAPPRRRGPGDIAPWLVAVSALGAVGLGGTAAVGVMRQVRRPDGFVVVAPTRLATAPVAPATGRAATDTVAIVERLGSLDSARVAPFAVELVATNAASDANSLLSDAARNGALPAATLSVVVVRRSAQGTARWHKVMAGAWRDARTADSALARWRRDGLVAEGAGAVVRAPFALLLADSASPERARAVMDVWRAKGVVPYAMVQDDGTSRVFAGAFETVAQGVTMAAMVRTAGGAPIVAYRTGRPD